MEKTGVCMDCPLKACQCIGRPEQPAPDILFIGGYPVQQDVDNGPFFGKNSSTLRMAVREVMCGRHLKPHMSIAYGYSTLCAPPWNEDAKKYDINADIFKRCSVHILEYIDRAKPAVIVAVGVEALHTLGYKGTEGDHRGSVLKFKTADGTEIPVIATFHVVKVAKDPGLYPTFRKDIAKAFSIFNDGGMESADLDIETPVEFGDVVSMLARARAEVAVEAARTGKAQGIAVDTETSSLKPYNPQDRVIAVSLSWKAGHGVAFPLEHTAHRYTEQQRDEILRALGELLSDPNVVIIMANGKFDLQWLKLHYGVPMRPLSFDTMLAEHLIDEDKKGAYSLKAITQDRFPSMGRYEKELQQHLHERWKAKDDEIAAILAGHKEREFARMVSWWVGLSEEERTRIFGNWVDKGYVDLTESTMHVKVQTRKVKGELVPKKAYMAKLVRTLRTLPEAELALYLPKQEAVIPEELTVKSFEDADLGILLRYAAIDAISTRLVANDQIKTDFANDTKLLHEVAMKTGKKVKTRHVSQALTNIALPMSEVLSEMEYHGIRLDRERAKEYQRILLEKMEETKEAMFMEVGRAFSVSSSSPDLGNILFRDMGLPVLKYTESGMPSTDADTLRQLAEEHDLPFLTKLLAYRKLDKCVHTYVDNWLKMSAMDGRLHCTFLQHGTATGRLSSSNPNLQNVPYQIKEAGLNLKALFLPDDGYDLYDLDISNAEMRTLCAYSLDEKLIDAFQHGKDLHCLTGAGISQYTYDDLMANKENKTTDQYRKRQLGKKVNFGTIYCIGAEGLSNQLWAEMRIRESPEQCQQYLDAFFETYPGVARYVNETKAFAERFKFVCTYTGRRRRFASAGFSRSGIARMQRQAVNAVIQSTSSDLVAYNMIDLRQWLIQHGGRLLLTVHDSMPFQLPHGMAESGGVMQEIRHIITERIQERAPWLPVEWKFDVGWGPDYGHTNGEVR